MTEPTGDVPAAVVLNAPLIRALMWGAGITTESRLAEMIGVDKSNMSRAMRGEQTPSLRMVDGIARTFPLAPYRRLCVRPGQADEPSVYGLTESDVYGSGH